MSAEQKELEKNALAAKLSGGWSKFKQGKIIGYKWMGIALLLIVGIGTWWYISSARKTENSKRWVQFEEANNVKKLEEIEAAYPDKIQGRLARLEIARHQLGPAGIDRLDAQKSDERQAAVANIEAARKSLEDLLGKFKDDLLFRVECLHGLAQAEAALLGVPAKEATRTESGQIIPATEYKGSLSRLVELLDQLAEAAEGTPWGNKAKERAAALRNPTSPAAQAFVDAQKTLFKPFAPGEGTVTLPQTPSGQN